jgi:ABC-type spermidine/putrescine transport system permease subunit II
LLSSFAQLRTRFCFSLLLLLLLLPLLLLFLLSSFAQRRICFWRPHGCKIFNLEHLS